jgi:hypothetical protein
MPGQPFCLAHLRDAADAIYERRGWQDQRAKDLKTTPRDIRRWFKGAEPLPDLRKQLAALCRKRGPYDPNMERMARKPRPA